MVQLVHPATRTLQHIAPNPSGSLVWQRTDTVGTELVFVESQATASADGEAVVAGPPAYASQWHARLHPDGTVQSVTVTCRGAGWRRALWLSRDDAGWSCRTEQTGDIAARLTTSGRAAQPLPGIDDPDRLDTAAVLRLADSPVFVTWAVRRLRLTPDTGPTGAPTVRVLAPSLAVLPGVSTYHLLGPRRLRISGAEPAITYDLDEGGIVAY